ncbi:MAG TPA: hypothetical protein VF018_03260 [Acidobacteriaceae bacterium]
MAVQEKDLQDAVARAERAEAKVAELEARRQDSKDKAQPESTAPSLSGEEELRKDSMMAHLLDSLNEGKDIGHYGRLVFAMVARHFMSEEEVISWLTRDEDFSEAQAKVMLTQVAGRDYNPPRRERILEWQAQQEFPILPHPEDPDCGNLYRNLKFPDSIYGHIEQYQEQKASAE